MAQINGWPAARPMLWLGQSVRTRIISASEPALRDKPLMVSLGDAIHRPRVAETYFTDRLRSVVGVSGPIMLDSGGFTMMTRNDPRWTVDRLAAIYDRVEADLLVSLDHPPTGHDTPSERVRKYERSLFNFQVLARRVDTRRLMPVVHGRTPAEIRTNAEGIQSVVGRPEWVGLGGLVPVLRRSGRTNPGCENSPQAFISKAIGQVRYIFPNARIHVFGVGSVSTMLAMFGLGADSVDSVGWRRAAGFGTIYLPGRGERFPTLRVERKRASRPTLDDADRDLLAICACPVCGKEDRVDARIAALDGHYVPRAIHNAWVLLEETANLRAQSARGEARSFLSQRLPLNWRTVLDTVNAEAPGDSASDAVLRPMFQGT